MAVLARKELEESPLSDLHAIASELGIEGFRLMRRDKLIDSIAGDGGGSSSDSGGEEERPQRRRSRGGRARTERKPAKKDADADADADAKDEGSDADDENAEVRGGVLDILPNGSGFMRPEAFTHSDEDVYVSPAQIRRCELRSGDQIEGPVRAPRRNERHPSLVRVDKVNGGDAEGREDRKRFDDLTPVFATKKLPAADGLADVPFGRGS